MCSGSVSASRDEDYGVWFEMNSFCSGENVWYLIFLVLGRVWALPRQSPTPKHK